MNAVSTLLPAMWFHRRRAAAEPSSSVLRVSYVQSSKSEDRQSSSSLLSYILLFVMYFPLWENQWIPSRQQWSKILEKYINCALIFSNYGLQQATTSLPPSAGMMRFCMTTTYCVKINNASLKFSSNPKTTLFVRHFALHKRQVHLHCTCTLTW